MHIHMPYMHDDRVVHEDLDLTLIKNKYLLLIVNSGRVGDLEIEKPGGTASFHHPQSSVLGSAGMKCFCVREKKTHVTCWF